MAKNKSKNKNTLTRGEVVTNDVQTTPKDKPVTNHGLLEDGGEYREDGGGVLQGVGVPTAAEEVVRSGENIPDDDTNNTLDLSVGRGRYHTVTQGDTVVSIANKYGVEIFNLLALNPKFQSHKERLYLGQRVWLGEGSPH